MKTRVQYLDIAKGIGILVVVWYHSLGPFHNYCSLFQLPLFFLISGYLYNFKSAFGKYTLRKIQTLYIPFIFWNICFYVLQRLYSFQWKRDMKFIHQVLLTLDKEWNYFGATWFLGALFTESVLYKFFDVILQKVPHRRWMIIILYVIRAFFSFQINLPHKLSRTCILGIFFAFGVSIKEKEEYVKKIHVPLPDVVLFMAALIAFCLIGKFTRYQMGDNIYSNPVLFVLGGMLGSGMTVALSKKMVASTNKYVNYVKKAFCLLGERSMDILIWHFVFFRVVIVMQLLIFKEPVADILKYGKRYVTSGAWWLIYIVVGILGSLVWGTFLKRGVWGKILKKLYIVR